MKRDNLDYAMDEIVQSVKEGASLVKEASSASDHLEKTSKTKRDFSSPVASALNKLASDIEFMSTEVTYQDINDVLFGDAEYYHDDSDNPLIKAANELDSIGLEDKHEKVAEVLNAAVGLSILRDKIYGDLDKKASEAPAVTASSVTRRGPHLVKKKYIKSPYSSVKSPVHNKPMR